MADEPVQVVAEKPVQQPAAAPSSRTSTPKGVVLSFVGDLITDGFRFVGILAPLMSIGFTLFKMLGPTDYNLHDISYAWALAPLVGWFGVAYWRRWSHSRTELQRAQEEIGALRVAMDNRAALNAARHRLALLRSAGVKVRNNGMETDILFEGLDAWCTEAEKWNEDVKSALAEIDPAMAEWFATLDAVPLPRVRPDKWANGRHAKMFHEHDFRLLKLERLILETPVVR